MELNALEIDKENRDDDQQLVLEHESTTKAAHGNRVRRTTSRCSR
jgi:hypothetical protein